MTDVIEKQRFVIQPGDNEVVQYILSMLISRNPDVPIEVTVGPYKKNRSLAQNSMMWMWLTAHAKEFGTTKERAYEEFKYYHVRPIFIRDDEDGGFTALESAAQLNPGMMKALINVISTSHLNTGQFSEALDEFDKRTAARGLALPHPDDLWHESMGK